MSLVSLKFVLTLGLFAAAVIALWTMLTLMGRDERSVSPTALRAMHRVFGYVALALAVVIGVIGYQLTALAGSAVTHRAVLHCSIAALFFVVFLFKVLIARHFRQFLKLMPALGLIAFALLFAVVAITAGHRIARDIWRPTATDAAGEAVTADEEAGSALALAESGDASPGRGIFTANCGGCHAHDTDEEVVGPSLMGLLEHEIEETGDRTEAFEEIRGQILRPEGTMPAFEGVFSEGELADLLAYLGTL